MSFSSLIFPCHIPKVKISTPNSRKDAAMGLGSPPLEYPSVMRNITFVAFPRACCNICWKRKWNCTPQQRVSSDWPVQYFLHDVAPFIWITQLDQVLARPLTIMKINHLQVDPVVRQGQTLSHTSDGHSLHNPRNHGMIWNETHFTLTDKSHPCVRQQWSWPVLEQLHSDFSLNR